MQVEWRRGVMKGIIRYIIICMCWIVYIEATDVQKTDSVINYQDLADKIGIEHMPMNTDMHGTALLVTDDRLLRDITPLLASKSVDLIAQYINDKYIPYEQKIRILNKLAGNRAYGLSNYDASQLILAVAYNYPSESPEQDRFFDLFVAFPDLITKTYPLYIAVEHGYNGIVKPFIAWASKMAAMHPEIQNELAQSKYRTFRYAVENDNVQVLQTLAELVGITKQEATDLLWYIAQSAKGVSTIYALRYVGADVDAVHEGKTPLITAVIHKHADVVQALINAGAQVQKMPDAAIGTALQQSIEHRDAYIERILRTAGAHE